MRLILVLLFAFISCNSKKSAHFSTIEIHDTALIAKINKFIAVNRQTKAMNEMIISSQLSSDTTIFYLIGDRKPNFKNNRQILGCAYVDKVLVWLQGEEPDGNFISISKAKTENRFEVDDIKGENVIILGHPLQWTLEFKNNTFVSCKSNNGKDCE